MPVASHCAPRAPPQKSAPTRTCPSDGQSQDRARMRACTARESRGAAHAPQSAGQWLCVHPRDVSGLRSGAGLRETALRPRAAPVHGGVSADPGSAPRVCGRERERTDGTCCKRSAMCSALVSWPPFPSHCRRAARSAAADLSTESGVEGPARPPPPAKRSSGCSGDARGETAPRGVAGAAWASRDWASRAATRITCLSSARSLLPSRVRARAWSRAWAGSAMFGT